MADTHEDTRPNSTSVSRAIKRFAGVRPHAYRYQREGVHVTGGGGLISVNIYVEAPSSRRALAESVEAALNMAGYEYTINDERDDEPFAGFKVTGRRDPAAEVPADAPLVQVDVIKQGVALVGIGGQQVQGRIGYATGRGGRFYVEDSDTEQVIAKAPSYRVAGELFARFHLVRGPIRVEVHRENDTTHTPERKA